MGCCESSELSAEDYEAKSESQIIDRGIEQERRILNQGNNVKVLLLGAGEGGKSTILKQMKILHIQGFGPDEVLQYKGIVCYYLLENMRNILETLEDHHVSLPQDLQEFQSMMKSVCEGGRPQSTLPEQIGEGLKSLWLNEKVQECVNSPNHHQLDDSVPYFFNSLDRLLSPSYIPSQEDIIRVRVRTTGIVEVNFSVTQDNRTLHFKMFDVAGQRSERRKWIHCFEGVTAVLFVVSLAEYDQLLMEDKTCNRMLESLNLFEAIVNNKFFTKSSFILFLNKKDLFEEKIKKSDFSTFFPEYKGGNNEGDISNWIKERYMEKNKVEESTGKLKKVYHHFTNATSTENIGKVFNNVIEIIIEKMLLESGLG